MNNMDQVNWKLCRTLGVCTLKNLFKELPDFSGSITELGKQLLMFFIAFDIYLVVSHCCTRYVKHCVPHLSSEELNFN
jgi:hypothetical protein